jgi:Arc/MetJ family transcription regulator
MAYTSGGTMRTNIVLDDQLLEEALALSEHRTKKDLIHEALRVFIRLKKRKNLSELAGKISLSDDFNHKRLRKLRG